MEDLALHQVDASLLPAATFIQEAAGRNLHLQPFEGVSGAFRHGQPR